MGFTTNGHYKTTVDRVKLCCFTQEGEKSLFEIATYSLRYMKDGKHYTYVLITFTALFPPKNVKKWFYNTMILFNTLKLPFILAFLESILFNLKWTTFLKA